MDKKKKKIIIAVCVGVIVAIAAGVLAFAFANQKAPVSALDKPVVTIYNETSTSVELEWQSINGASDYTIYRSLTDNEDDFGPVVRTQDIRYLDENLTTATTYYYYITANGNNAKSVSDVVSVVVGPPSAPDKALDVTATSMCTAVAVTWSAVDRADGYEVYSKTGESDFVFVADVPQNEYIQQGVEIGYEATYKVCAYKDDNGTKIYGEFSDEAMVKVEHVASTSWTMEQNATCATDGKRSNVCMYCGAVFSEIIPMDTTIHKYKTTVVSPTCLNEGYTVYVCSVCGKMLTDNFTEPTGHIQVETSRVKANCLDDGYTEYECSLCHIKWRETQKANGHALICVTVPATCEGEGYSTYTCTTCLEHYNADFVNPLGHDYIMEETVASCTDSVTRSYSCSRCSATYIENGDSTGHQYQLTEIVAPTCHTDGYDLYSCIVCTATYRDNIVPMLEHDMKPQTVATTCQGNVDIEKCSNCGFTVFDESVYDYHNFEEYYNFDPETFEPKCGDYLTITLVCADCQLSLLAEAEYLSHNYQIAKTQSPTCTAEGYNLYKCVDCGDEYRADIVEKLNHQWSATQIVPPSCTASGYTQYKCTRCPTVYTGDFVNPTGHTYKTTTVAPTCTSRGYDIDICEICSFEGATTNYVAKIGHNYEATANTYPATCTDDGFYGYKCSNCGQPDASTMTNVVEKLGHNLSTEYTVDEKGYRYYNCSRCAEGYVDTTCYIDISSQTISVAGVALFEQIEAQGDKPAYTKLTLDPDGTSDYEITGTAQNLAIKVNVTFECDVKLAGVNINNTGIYGIDFDDETVDESLQSTADNEIEDRIPEVALSAKEGTVNYITINQSGNAIENSCNLDIKGHGTLNLSSVSTTIDSKGKVEIKNLTLNITSGNRGIDTKEEIYNEKGQLIDEEFYNVTIKGNADVTINSADDAIRCKKFEMSVLDADEINSTLTIISGGDGIQAEGKKKGVIIFNSGVANITATGTALKSDANTITIYDSTQIKY